MQGMGFMNPGMGGGMNPMGGMAGMGAMGGMGAQNPNFN